MSHLTLERGCTSALSLVSWLQYRTYSATAPPHIISHIWSQVQVFCKFFGRHSTPFSPPSSPGWATDNQKVSSVKTCFGESCQVLGLANCCWPRSWSPAAPVQCQPAGNWTGSCSRRLQVQSGETSDKNGSDFLLFDLIKKKRLYVSTSLSSSSVPK